MVTIQIRFSRQRPLVDVQAVRDVEQIVQRELTTVHADLAVLRQQLEDQHTDQMAAHVQSSFLAYTLAMMGLAIAFTALGLTAATISLTAVGYIGALVTVALAVVMARRAFPPRPKQRWWSRRRK